MSKEICCENCKYEHSPHETQAYEEPCKSCCGHDKFELYKQTNYDRIRNMSVEKLSDFLMDWAMEFMCGQVPLNVKSWLEQEVEE